MRRLVKATLVGTVSSSTIDEELLTEEVVEVPLDEEDEELSPHA
jgi:hypothetical protein